MTFAHPAALWCLAALPVVVAIHFLQRRSQRQIITTLFLLQPWRRESEVGHRFERLRTSLPLLMQLLSVLVLTWLLAAPRWAHPDAVQRLALVLDSSASMTAFRPEAEQAVAEVLNLRLPQVRAELALLVSDPSQPALYHGDSATDLLTALSRWQPDLGVHDVSPALRAGRELVTARGNLVLVTDHTSPQPLPWQATCVAVGHEKANVGWAGARVEEREGQLHWRALLHNPSRTAQTREWQVEAGTGTSAWQSITLPPGATHALSGPFPPQEELRLRLKPDAFARDDTLPLVRPKPKPLSLHLPAPLMPDGTAELREWMQRLPGFQATTSLAQADLRAFVWPPSVALEDDQHAIVFASPPKGDHPAWLRGEVVAEAHPLIEGLNWQSLLAAEGMIIPQDERERVLLWQGKRPLITLRRTPAGAQQLFCHFDLTRSNALKLPAMAILLHRFLSQVRQEKIAPQAANYDTRQRLNLAHERGPTAPDLELRTREAAVNLRRPVTQAHLLRAPSEPGFFEVWQGNRRLLQAAASFADLREADLREASAQNDLTRLSLSQSDEVLRPDPWARLWMLLLLALLLASWWWSRDSTRQEPRVVSH
jgi:hypothetical protein